MKLETKIEFIFPTCQTCVFVDLYHENGLLFCLKHFMGLGEKVRRDPDKFFCSEHETKDGERFVNWGTK